jgi:two-component system, OmpR family, response regulator PrrA
LAPSTAEVLVVDDDQGTRDALRRGLTLENFTVRDAPDAMTALRELDQRIPSVLVVDVAMPGLNGVELTRRIRTDGRSLPICILSARDEVDDRVAGLAAGADDYVVKPFSIAELAARLHAMIRLHERSDDAPVRVGELVIEPSRRAAARDARALDLTGREFDLLTVLARHPGQVLSRTQLLEQVWGYTWDVDTNVVDVFVGYLRRKLESAGEARMLHTVRGIGFTLRP